MHRSRPSASLRALALLLLIAVVARTTSAFSSTAARAAVASRAVVLPSRLAASSSDEDDEKSDDNSEFASDVRRALLASTLAAVSYNVFTLGSSALGLLPAGYERVSPLQFVAALGDPDASAGNGAGEWGLWRTDPGPRGLRLRDYERIERREVGAPAWLNKNDFFLDENAIIMPQPEFPMPPGKYLVTGARTVTTGLTIAEDGTWTLDEGKLYDVTHLPCRAARYNPAAGESGSPATVRRADFPVAPGGIMPDVPGTDKRIYSVLFVVGKKST